MDFQASVEQGILNGKADERGSIPVIIDIHVHPFSLDPQSVPKQIRQFERVKEYCGIDLFCLLGHVTAGGYDPDRKDITRINDFTLRMVMERPNLFLGFCYLNPRNPERYNRREFIRCVVEGPLRGVKLWVSVPCTDRRLNALMDWVSESDVPILHHAWYKSVGHVCHESNPAQVAEWAAEHPQVKIIMAHLTGVGVRGILDVASCKNVYVDTSGSQPAAGILEYAVKVLGSKRILFGSDAGGRDFAVQLARIHCSRLSKRDKLRILGKNAATVLRLGRRALRAGEPCRSGGALDA